MWLFYQRRSTRAHQNIATVILYSLKDKNGTRRVSRKLLHHASGKGLFRVPRPLRPSGRGRRGGVRQVRMFFSNLRVLKEVGKGNLWQMDLSEN